ncbi:glutathione transferase [Pseudomonas hygromyciniae]|uniref:Glutathione transferase n=2 Tax=Pseudomonas hygromyciniae TaxID=2812000 RepID=A0ABX7K281_9PSED|nr:glutathione transferase [Pseudomonas hygromyciniae]MBN0980207.1 glutathione transferase [Pseudomonas hygromyciniae]QSB41735.1 glutathione transferase [Pseudomonas hygromyciniae]
MTNLPMRLYVDALFTSPYAMSVFVTLQEKGLPFEVRTLDLDALEQQAPAFAGLSVTQRVPTLEQDGFALSESSAITEYLDEMFPDVPVYPTQPRLRARARQIQAWLRSDLLPIRQERSTLVVFCGAKYGPLSTQAQAAADKLIAAAQCWLAAGDDYLFGQWSIADLDLAVMLNRLILNGDPVPAPLVAYAQRQWQRPSVQAWVSQARPAL